MAARVRGLGLLLAALLAVAAGCARQGDDAIALGLAQAPLNLDPRTAADATSERINRLLYARLVDLDDAGLPVPGIARWEQLGPTRYRFQLGTEGRCFIDGSWLTAEDVAATYRSVLDPATASPHRTPLASIQAIRVLDADRFEIDIAAPDPLFPAYLGVGIVPARLARADAGLARAPVGSGGFAFVDWPTPGRLVIARRDDGQRIAFVAVKDANVRVMKLLRGEIDLLQNDLPPELVDLLAHRAGVRVETAPGANFSYLGLNLADPATGDARVRAAIAAAIDRAAIVEHLFQGRARLAEGLLPPEHWAGVPGLAPYPHDPERARALLAAAGYGGDRPLRITLKTSSDPFRLRLATVFQAQLGAVGIDARVQSYDWGTFFGDIRAGRFQLYGLTWVGVRLPDIFRYAFHSASVPPDGANRGRYRNPAADALIDRARAEPSLAAQAPMYRELAALLHADLPYIPLWYEDQVAVLRQDIIGYRLAADGDFDGLNAVRRAGTGGVPAGGSAMHSCAPSGPSRP